jgi:hypothetical protein
MKDKHRQAYIINKVTDNKYQLCRVINDYDSNVEVNEDLTKLLTNKITEKDLLDMFDKKQL